MCCNHIKILPVVSLGANISRWFFFKTPKGTENTDGYCFLLKLPGKLQTHMVSKHKMMSYLQWWRGCTCKSCLRYSQEILWPSFSEWRRWSSGHGSIFFLIGLSQACAWYTCRLFSIVDHLYCLTNHHVCTWQPFFLTTLTIIMNSRQIFGHLMLDIKWNGTSWWLTPFHENSHFVLVCQFLEALTRCFCYLGHEDIGQGRVTAGDLLDDWDNN